MADVRTTAFTRIIKEKLFSGSEFLKLAVSHDGFVNDKTVEIPLAGALPDVARDRGSFPIPVIDRTDDKQSYNLIEYSLGTIRVSDKNKRELSYDQAASILRQHVNKLNDEMGLDGAYNLGGADLVTAGGQLILTTGTATAGIAPPSGTGNRKALTLADMANSAKKLDKDKVSNDGRYMLIPSDIYWDFVEKNKAQLLNLDYNKNLSNGDIANGVVSKVYGFKIIQRAHTLVYADAATPTKKAVGAAGATTDHWACVGWQMDEVSRALGTIKVFSEMGSPTYQADLYSALVRFNNTPMRKDGTGIVTIVQDS